MQLIFFLQSTAKGTLTQMLNMVFHRLERQSQEQVRRRDVAAEIISDIVSKVVGEPIKEVRGCDDDESAC